jgi:hypothetical protein
MGFEIGNKPSIDALAWLKGNQPPSVQATLPVNSWLVALLLLSGILLSVENIS